MLKDYNISTFLKKNNGVINFDLFVEDVFDKCYANKTDVSFFKFNRKYRTIDLKVPKRTNILNVSYGFINLDFPDKLNTNTNSNHFGKLYIPLTDRVYKHTIKKHYYNAELFIKISNSNIHYPNGTIKLQRMTHIIADNESDLLRFLSMVKDTKKVNIKSKDYCEFKIIPFKLYFGNFDSRIVRFSRELIDVEESNELIDRFEKLYLKSNRTENDENIDETYYDDEVD